MRAGANVSFQGKEGMGQARAELPLPPLVTTLSLSVRRYNRRELGTRRGNLYHDIIPL